MSRYGVAHKPRGNPSLGDLAAGVVAETGAIPERLPLV